MHPGREGWRGARDAALTAMLVAGLAAGCGTLRGGAKSAGGAKPVGGARPAGAAGSPGEAAATPLRPDVDRLQAELTELRALVESARRASVEHSDAGVRGLRGEIEAVQRALEASARDGLQRQVEVLDAQARRIDLLEKRAADMGQVLRRVELTVAGLESQLGRLLDAMPPPVARAPARGAAAGRPSPTPGEPSGARPARPAAPTSAPAPGGTPAPTGAALLPPAMLGLPGAPRTGASAVPGAEARPAPAEGEAARPPKATGAPAAEARPAPAERPPGGEAARPAKPTAPEAAPVTALTARALFDRAMDNWKKGEPGQAVLDLEDLVQTFPADPLVPSAKFWIGEAYYAARDFERAAIEYQRAVELAPKGKDAPQALLRLGLAHRAQRREADARQAWNRLVRDFPTSDAAEEARRALRGR